MSEESEDDAFAVAEYLGPALSSLPEKANPALPDHVWQRLQELGDVATLHLQRILMDGNFRKFAIKDQMRVIETTLQRAYGSPDGSVRRHLHVHTDPEGTKGFNALRDMSLKAQRRLPEFRSPHRGEAIEEAVTVPANERKLAK